jgi:hypothetical protein
MPLSIAVPRTHGTRNARILRLMAAFLTGILWLLFPVSMVAVVLEHAEAYLVSLFLRAVRYRDGLRAVAEHIASRVP